MKERSLKILLVLLLLLSSFPHAVFANEGSGDVQSTPEGETLPENEETNEENNTLIEPETQEDPVLSESDTEEDPDLNEENADPETIVQSVEELLTDVEEEEETKEEELYDRTILMYAVGSDLESLSGLCSFNLRQILNSEFSKDDKIKFIVMTGGADEEDGWHLESKYLCDPSGKELETISTDYNCIWEAKGLDADENAGKLVLLDGDGISGDGDEAVPAVPIYDDEGELVQDGEYMSDPEVLKAFINYGYYNYPAKEYDIIFWDHGSGIYSGFGKDEHSGVLMLAGEMAYAIRESDLYQNDKRFGFINFDACLMSSVELALLFAPYTHYYIASPEVIPGNGQYYTGWLNMLGDDPDISDYTLGKKIVDDYYEYYENNEESGMDGTLALIDTDLLTEDGVFVDALLELNRIMWDQLFKAQTYDELTAISRSITYGGNPYYVDFGNLVSQLCVKVKEFDGEPAGSKDLEVNEYYGVAEKIMKILNDKDIIYSRCTSGIHTNDDIMYREFSEDEDGQIKFATDGFPLTSSGLYIFMESVDPVYYREYQYYDRNIAYTLAEGVLSPKVDGDALKVINEYLNTIKVFALLIQTGKTISQMLEDPVQTGEIISEVFDIPDFDFDKEDISYETVLAYWQYKKFYSEDTDSAYSDWDFYERDMFRDVHNLLNEPFEEDGEPYKINDKDPKFKAWMEQMIGMMAEEAIDKNGVELYEVVSRDGKGYRVRMNDVKKRVVDKVAYELIAEFPILNKYIEDNDLDWIFSGNSSKDIEVPIGVGTIFGSELFDMDLEESDDLINDYIEWLNGNTSTWDLDPIEEKWYAITDAEGKNHAVAIEEYNDLLLIPTKRQVEVVDEFGEKEFVDELVALFFDGEDLVSFMIKEDGAYRPMEAKELKTELKLETCLAASSFFGRVYLPISTKMVINPENVDQIKLIYTDIDNIPDIEDTTEDGEKLTKRIVIYNIYGEKVDITDMTKDPKGILRDISEAKVLDDEYTGEVLSPRIVFEGRLLKEGEDYKLIKATDADIYQKPGEYRFFIEGIGNYVGGAMLDYNITPSYTITDGANGSFRKGDKNGLVFRFTRLGDDENTFKHFKEVLVDGKKIDPSTYEARQGSVIIALKTSYLETLSAGDHTITAVFDDGRSKAIRFTVLDKKSDNKKEEKKTYNLPLTGIEN